MTSTIRYVEFVSCLMVYLSILIVVFTLPYLFIRYPFWRRFTYCLFSLFLFCDTFLNVGICNDCFIKMIKIFYPIDASMEGYVGFVISISTLCSFVTVIFTLPSVFIRNRIWKYRIQNGLCFLLFFALFVAIEIVIVVYKLGKSFNH
jgi:hypothetical protein